MPVQSTSSLINFGDPVNYPCKAASELLISCFVNPQHMTNTTTGNTTGPSLSSVVVK